MVVAIMAIAWVVSPASAMADPSDGGGASDGGDTAAGADAGDTQSVPTMVILDASGSMKETDGDDAGSTRMEAAKQAADTLVDEVPADARLGLTVYGAHSGNKAEDKEKGCQDVEVVTPVGTDNGADLKEAIDGTEASGYTPIGTALRKAADALPADGDRAIVLVSDGIDSCAPPPPCEVAQDLKNEGVDLTIHTIGFRVDDDARADLECIADATGGTYSDAQDGEQLSDQLVTRATRSMEGYEVSGTPITGGETMQKAVPVDPGQYLDSMAEGSDKTLGDGSELYYAVHLEEGERVHASATLVPPPGDAHFSDVWSLGVDLEILGSQGNDCVGDHSDVSGENASNAGDMPVIAAAHSEARGEDEHSDDCNEDTVFIRVVRQGTSRKDEPLPVELVVAIEKANTVPEQEVDADALEIEDTEGATEVEPESDEPVALGRSFASATPVEPGSFVVEMVPGDVRYVKIPVAEGQRLRYRAEVLDPGEQPTDSPDTSSFGLSFFDPLRVPQRSSYLSSTEELDLNNHSGVMAGGMPAVTHATNRNAGGAAREVSSHWLGGDQYVMLNLDALTGVKDEAKNVPATFLVTFQVDGDAETGPELVTETAPPENTTVDDQGNTGAAADPSGRGEEGSSGLSLGRIALIGGASLAGIVGLGAIGGAVWLLRRRG
jgi:Ca-activated chloride channel family protein